MFEISEKDINQLDQIQMHQLLKRLLHNEAFEHGISRQDINVSLNILVPDGGEDGYIEWQKGPDNTEYIPASKTCYQSKAYKNKTNFSPAYAAKEILEEKSNKLKERVDHVLKRDGAYVIFTSLSLNSREKQARITSIRETLTKLAYPNASTFLIKIYDADTISGWCNKYVSAVIFVRNLLDKQSLGNARTWDDWSKYKNFSQINFMYSDKSTKYIDEIRNTLSSSRQSIRIIGLSGLGKSRLVLEVFNLETTDILHASKYRMIYFDANGFSTNSNDIVGLLRNNPDGVIVIDNCPLDLHLVIEKEIHRTDSKASMISIFSNPEESSAASIVKIETQPDEVIEGILKQFYTSLNQGDIERIVAFSQGFPLIAVRLGQFLLAKDPQLGKLNDDQLKHALLWSGTTYDKEAENIITCYSIFEKIGFVPPYDVQYKEIATIFGFSEEKAYEILNNFIRRGVFEQNGHFIRIRPQPLAVELASKWWMSASKDRVDRVLDALSDTLANSLCDRMTKLDFLPEAKKFVSHICGPQGSFGKAEVLNTELGSRLFRSLVEVNPAVCASAIQQAFSNWPTENFLNIVSARRNLIAALEKLAFRAETFFQASDILLRLAAAENESWSNNATGIFVDLFHVNLSGTEADPNLRFSIIDYALSNEDLKIKAIGIKALGHVLKNSHFSRTLGAERQGALTTLCEWKPKYWGEIFDYWNLALDRIYRIISDETNTVFIEEAISVFAEKFPEVLISNEMVDSVDKVIQKISILYQGYWPAGYKSAKFALKRTESFLPENPRVIIQKWIDQLSPTSQTPENMISMIVSIPAFSQYEENEDGKLIDMGDVHAIEFANEVSNNFSSWKIYIHKVFSGIQRKALIFGNRLGELLSKENGEELINIALETLANDNVNEKNCYVIAGFLKTFNTRFPSKVEETLSTVFNNKKLQCFFAIISQHVGLNPKLLEQINILIASNIISTDEARVISYGKSLDNLQASDVIEFAKVVMKIKPDGGWAALEIIGMYCHKDPNKWSECLDFSKSLITSPEVDLSIAEISITDIHHYETVAIMLLNNNDPGFAKILSNNLIASVDSGKTRHDIPKELLSALFKMYFQECWPIFYEALSSENLFFSHQLQMILGSGFGDKKLGGVLFESVDADIICNWINSQGIEAARIISRMTPVFAEDNKKLIWHKVAIWILDNFGNDDEVLSGLSANFGTYSWVGSLVPYLKMQETLLISLNDHSTPSVKSWANQKLQQLRDNIHERELYEQDIDS